MWGNILIVQIKLVFLQKISKTVKAILIKKKKKIVRNHYVMDYKKVSYSKHPKNDIIRDIQYFFKISVFENWFVTSQIFPTF